MDIRVASTAIGLINSTVQTAKTAIELAKHTKDSELRNSVSEVLNQILDLKEKVLELDDENRSLKEQILARADVERRVLLDIGSNAVKQTHSGRSATKVVESSYIFQRRRPGAVASGETAAFVRILPGKYRWNINAVEYSRPTTIPTDDS